MTEVLLVLAMWQQQTGTRVYGMSGPVVSTSRTDGTTTQTVRNLNGREVPVETSDEKVISSTPTLRIVERTIRRYDANGRPGPAEKVRIETRSGSGGATEVSTTVWRGDINGNVQIAERSVAVTRSTGGENSDTTVTVERPTSDGRLEVHERKEESRRATGPGKTSESATTQRRDLNGRWTDVLRTTAEQTRSGANLQENRAEYEAATTGQMRLVRQVVSRTTGAPGGSSVTERDIFEPALAGRATSGDEPLKLTRQQVVERTATAAGTVESLSVRFADPSSPGRLGALQKVEETTCKGECQPAMMK